MSREGLSGLPTGVLWGARLGLSLVLGTLVAAPALAQVTGTENGIKMGEGRVHPYFDFELAYDSAAGFFSQTAGTPTLSGEMLAHFRPGFRLELPASFVNLNLSADVDYVYYTGLVSPGSDKASHVEAAANLEADFNKTGPVEFDIGDNFSRLDQTANLALGIGTIALFNNAHVALPIHPGGGALEITPSGALSLEQYTALTPGAVGPNCLDANCTNFNYLDFQAGLQGRWRFLPKTALVVEGTYDARSYSADPHPAEILHAEAGLVGLVTSKIAVTAKAGWAQDFLGSGGSTVVGHLELSYLLSDTSSLKAGFLRDVQAVPTYGTFGDDRVYAEARFFLGGRLTLHAYGAYDFLNFNSGSGRNDGVVTVDAGPQYQFTRWLIGSLGYTLNYRNSNQATTQFINYTRNVVYARITLTY